MKERKNNKTPKTSLRALVPTGNRDEGFFQQVYELARQVPKGRVTSFGAIARCLGAAKSARMVGWALSGSSTVRPKVPAHRVVNAQGLLSGKFHFETLTRMEELLAREGVIVKNDQVVDFKTLFWDPSRELGL